jgi:DNA mismatch repair protein MutL
VINLDVPAPEVDVNVHPSKSEVKLLRERLIYGALRDAVRSAVSASSGWAKELSIVSPSQLDADPAMVPARLRDVPPAAPVRGTSVFAGGRRLPILRVVGQIAQTYIIAEGVGGLYLIDQHAAHERVLLEKLTKSIGRDGNTQLMLEPQPIEVSPAEWEALSRSKPELEDVGYRLEPFGERSALVRGIPVELPEGRAVEALRETLADLAEEKPAGDWRERVAIALSCRGAVKAGQVLAPDEMRSLVMALEEMDITQHCSHGRPTAVLLSHTQLEKEFGRR